MKQPRSEFILELNRFKRISPLTMKVRLTENLAELFRSSEVRSLDNVDVTPPLACLRRAGFWLGLLERKL